MGVGRAARDAALLSRRRTISTQALPCSVRSPAGCAARRRRRPARAHPPLHALSARLQGTQYQRRCRAAGRLDRGAEAGATSRRRRRRRDLASGTRRRHVANSSILSCIGCWRAHGAAHRRADECQAGATPTASPPRSASTSSLSIARAGRRELRQHHGLIERQRAYRARPRNSRWIDGNLGRWP